MNADMSPNPARFEAILPDCNGWPAMLPAGRPSGGQTGREAGRERQAAGHSGRWRSSQPVSRSPGSHSLECESRAERQPQRLTCAGVSRTVNPDWRRRVMIRVITNNNFTLK